MGLLGMGKNRSLTKTFGEFSPWVRQDDEADGAYWEVRAVRFLAHPISPGHRTKRRGLFSFKNNGTVRALTLTHMRENPEAEIKKIGILKKTSEKEIRLSPERMEQGVDIG